MENDDFDSWVEYFKIALATVLIDRATNDAEAEILVGRASSVAIQAVVEQKRMAKKCGRGA